MLKREQDDASSDDETLDFGLVLSDEESAYSDSDLEKDNDESQAGIISDQDTLEHEASDEEALFDSGVKVLRRHDLPEIEADYHSDSSDQELENTIGNVPLAWYEDYPHIGYDIHGQKILRPAKGDELDKFLSSMDDPAYLHSVYDKATKSDIELTKEQLDVMKRIMQHEFPDAGFDPYQPTVEWFTQDVEVHPLSDAPEPKRRFIPSKLEAKKIMKIARAIRSGLIVPGTSKVAKTSKPKAYSIWDETDEPREDHPMHIPPPKMTLPQHNESYNPPEEYLMSPEELKEWEDLDPEDRPTNFIPKKHDNLRSVGSYTRFIQERFDRCLDLYLCPRLKKKKVNIDPESLIPKLPSPKELKPFPTVVSVLYKGHAAKVRSISIDPLGIWLASASDDKTVKLWEISSGRCLKTWTFDEAPLIVRWNPNKNIPILATAIGKRVIFLNPELASSSIAAATMKLVEQIRHNESDKMSSWEQPSSIAADLGHLLHLTLPKSITDLAWHRKGDYLATVSPEASSHAVLIHQLSKARSQSPFSKSKGLVQRVCFHPTKPLFYVATQQNVRIYNLMKQDMVKKLQSGVKWISSMDIHPGGDNLILGSYDKRLCWFDMDLSSKPYKTLRYHKMALRDVSFHKKYPLFASASDDGNVNIFHGMVYNDLMQNPLLVPVKTLQAHSVTDHLGALGVEFHPSQPWIVSAGADGLIKLWS